MHRKFCGDRPRGTPLSRELNLTGVAKYSDFGPIEGYISEAVQDSIFYADVDVYLIFFSLINVF